MQFARKRFISHDTALSSRHLQNKTGTRLPKKTYFMDSTLVSSIVNPLSMVVTVDCENVV